MNIRIKNKLMKRKEKIYNHILVNNDDDDN